MRTHRTVSYRSLAALALAVALTACSSAGSNTTVAAQQATADPADACPQPRETERAPDSYFMRVNPLPRTAANLELGRRLYEREARPEPCASCHGVRGNDAGARGQQLVPAPRNFACAATMANITDGQMYWVIQNGSGELHLPARQGAQQIERPGRRTRFTAMRAYREYLSDAETWQLILYIRSLAQSDARAESTAEPVREDAAPTQVPAP